MPAQRTPDTQPAPFSLGEHNASTPSLNDKDAAALQFDSAGNLLINLAVGSGVSNIGTNNISTSQVNVDNTLGGVQIVGVRATRQAVLIVNLGTTDVYIGVSGLTTSTGSLLPGTKGAFLSIPTVAAVFGITAGATQALSVIEAYN